MNAAEKEAYEERAAIMEFCGGMTRAVADALARAEVLSHREIAQPPTPPPLPPEKMGKHYGEFQEFWRTRKQRR